MSNNRKERQGHRHLIRLCLCALLALTLLAGQAMSAPCYAEEAVELTDVRSTDWYHDNVYRARELGIISGYPDGTFRGQNNVSYAEFVKMAVLVAGDAAMEANAAAEAAEATAGGVTPYKGLENHWVNSYYGRAVAAGIFYEEEIPPRVVDRPIPRGYVAMLASNILEKYGIYYRRQMGDDFTDILVSSVYEYYVRQCVGANVISGYSDGTFRPGKPITRAEAATVLVKLNDVIAKWQALPEEERALAEKNPDADKPKASVCFEEQGDPFFKEFVDVILKSFKITGTEGKYQCSVHMPAASDKYKVYVGAYMWYYLPPGTPMTQVGYYLSTGTEDKYFVWDMNQLGHRSNVDGVQLDWYIKNQETKEYAGYFMDTTFGEDQWLRLRYDPPNSDESYYETRLTNLDHIFLWR